jgi:hypothetical protein
VRHENVSSSTAEIVHFYDIFRQIYHTCNSEINILYEKDFIATDWRSECIYHFLYMLVNIWEETTPNTAEHFRICWSVCNPLLCVRLVVAEMGFGWTVRMRWWYGRRWRFCRKCVIGDFAHDSVLCLVRLHYSDSQMQNDSDPKEEGWVGRHPGWEWVQKFNYIHLTGWHNVKYYNCNIWHLAMIYLGRPL